MVAAMPPHEGAGCQVLCHHRPILLPLDTAWGLWRASDLWVPLLIFDGMLKVCTKAGLGICRQRGAGAAVTNLPRSGLCLPWGWAGLGVACPQCHLCARACWNQNQRNPAKLQHFLQVRAFLKPVLLASSHPPNGISR